MIKRFTYKELTLLIGVVVALIVIFTLWIRQPLDVYPRTSKAPVLSEIHKLKNTALKNYISVFEELLSGRNSPY